MGGVQFVWHGHRDTLSLNAVCSKAREEKHECDQTDRAPKGGKVGISHSAGIEPVWPDLSSANHNAVEEGVDIMDIENSNLNYDFFLQKIEGIMIREIYRIM